MTLLPMRETRPTSRSPCSAVPIDSTAASAERTYRRTRGWSRMNSNVMGEGGPPVCVTSVALRVPGWLMMGISLCGNDATRFTGGSEAVGWATLGSQLEERQARAGFRHDALTP